MKNYKLNEGIVIGIILGTIIFITDNTTKPPYADRTFDIGFFLGMMFAGIISGLIIELIITLFRSRN